MAMEIKIKLLWDFFSQFFLVWAAAAAAHSSSSSASHSSPYSRVLCDYAGTVWDADQIEFCSMMLLLFFLEPNVEAEE